MSLLLKRKKVNPYRIGEVHIQPGMNEFTDPDVIKSLKKHPAYQAMLKSGVHVEVEAKSSNKDEEVTADITSMTAKDAIAVIKETLVIANLENMYEREEDDKGRSSVLAAIRGQIESIKTPDGGGTGNKDED